MQLLRFSNCFTRLRISSGDLPAIWAAWRVATSTSGHPDARGPIFIGLV